MSLENVEDEPESTLPSLLQQKMISLASQRRDNDRWLEAIKNSLVEALRRIDGSGVTLIQRAIDSLDEYLKRSKSER